MKRFLLLILLTAPGGAHIGSPDAFFEGDAGPYHLFVTIRKPPVVPGVAEFELRSPADDIKDVRIALGDAGRFDESLLPVPDQAIQSKADPQSFTSGIWLMSDGAMIAKVWLDGAKGKAEIAIPFTSYAQRVLPLGRAPGAALFGLMMFLAAGVVAIVSAGVREGFLHPVRRPRRDRSGAPVLLRPPRRSWRPQSSWRAIYGGAGKRSNIRAQWITSSLPSSKRCWIVTIDWYSMSWDNTPGGQGGTQHCFKITAI